MTPNPINAFETYNTKHTKNTQMHFLKSKSKNIETQKSKELFLLYIKFP